MAATALLAFPLGITARLGQDFFPSVDAGQIKLHLRTPTGLRIDETATLCDRVEATIRQLIPAHEITTSSTTSASPTAASSRVFHLGAGRRAMPISS